MDELITNDETISQTDVSEEDQDRDLNEWTIMIYHSGETDLSEEFVWAVKEMVRVGTPDKVEVVALMDSVSPDLWMFTIPRATANEQETTTAENEPQQSDRMQELYERGGIFNSKRWEARKITKRELDDWEPEQSGDRTTRTEGEDSRPNLASSRMLRNFVTRTIKKHPAFHYMLILSGHGDGMVGNTLLLDQGAGTYMSVPKLSWALGDIVRKVGRRFKEEQQKIQVQFKERFQEKQGENLDPRLDILGFDACGMLTAEVSYLLKEEVQYIVASEGIMHKAGWPYHLILDYLNKNNNVGPDKLADATVRRCVRYYSDFARVGLSIEMAAVHMRKEESEGGEKYPDWEALAAALKKLTDKLSSAISPFANTKGKGGGESTITPADLHIKNALIVAHWYAQSYALEHYVDIQDFCEQLKLAAPELSGECQDVIDALSKVVARCCYSGAAVQHSHGLSLFFPWSATDAQLHRYSWYGGKKRREKKLTPFNEATGWGDFLWDFTYATRRKVREGRGELIYMPPPGYRDHLKDYHANSKKDTAFDLNNAPPVNFRSNPPSPRSNPPSPRLIALAGSGIVPFAKIKNPAMAFHEEAIEGRPEKDNENR